MTAFVISRWSRGYLLVWISFLLVSSVGIGIGGFLAARSPSFIYAQRGPIQVAEEKWLLEIDITNTSKSQQVVYATFFNYSLANLKAAKPEFVGTIKYSDSTSAMYLTLPADESRRLTVLATTPMPSKVEISNKSGSYVFEGSSRDLLFFRVLYGSIGVTTLQLLGIMGWWLENRRSTRLRGPGAIDWLIDVPAAIWPFVFGFVAFAAAFVRTIAT